MMIIRLSIVSWNDWNMPYRRNHRIKWRPLKEALQQLSSSGGAEVDALLNEQRQQWQQEQAVAIQSLQQEHAVTIQSLQEQLQQQVAESNNAQMQMDE